MFFFLAGNGESSYSGSVNGMKPKDAKSDGMPVMQGETII